MIKSGAIALGALAVLVAATWATFKYLLPYWPYSPEVGAAVFMGALAGVIAIWAIFSQRAITRRQCTLEYIAMLETDGDLIRGRAKFRELVNTPGALVALAAADKEQTTEFQIVVTRLNEFELISIGIQRGIIDLELYSLWYKTGTVRAWRDAQPFIAALRNRIQKQELFYEFEQMVGWFEKHNRPPRSYFWGRFF